MEEKEIIKSIEEVCDLSGKEFIGIADTYGFYDGYCVETNKNKYYFLIESGTQCCEECGYISLEDYDSIQNCAGLELRDIKITGRRNYDIQLSDKIKKETLAVDIDECRFVDVNCGDISNLNTIHFAVYNSHNGYYSHRILYLKTSLDNDVNDILLEDWI